MKNERYGQMTNNSIYESPIINEYVLGGYLRFQLHKDNLSEGYYSGYKNNVGEFYFETRKKITNIYDYFRNGNFESLTTGINVSLYDIVKKSSEKYISFLIQRPDITNHNIPLSELKIFLKKEVAEKNIDLDAGDEVEFCGKVFSTALGDAWIDVDDFKVVNKIKKEENKK